MKKWMLTGLSTVLAVSIMVPAAGANTLNELEQKQQQIEQEKNELNSGINEKKEAISTNASKLEQIMAKITELDDQINETQGKITEVEGEIEQTKVEIAALKQSIEELEKKIAERDQLLQDRARAIQLSGGSVDYIDVLLGANSFIDFIDRFSAVNTLIEADREIMREQAIDKELLAKQKKQVETKLADQEARQAELLKLKASLDSQKNEQASLVSQLQAEQSRLANEKSSLESNYQEALEISSDLEKQISAEQARLAEVARKAEEERQRKLAAERKAAEEAEAKAAQQKAAQSQSSSQPASKPSYEAPPAVSAPANSGGFIRPASGRLSSNYGGRNIGSGHENHFGIDIAAPTGTPIMAAASGYVSYAGPMGTYGNVIMVTHSINGQTHTTVYAHLSAISVSVNQSVSQGQRIGSMGSTGRSTGPHLHFEIHIGPWNGSRSNAVNPIGYIGG